MTANWDDTARADGAGAAVKKLPALSSDAKNGEI